MRFRRFLAASVVGGLLLLTGCDVDELLGLEVDGYSVSDESEYGVWPDDYWTWEEPVVDDGGYWSDDILDRKSG